MTEKGYWNAGLTIHILAWASDLRKENVGRILELMLLSFIVTLYRCPREDYHSRCQSENVACMPVLEAAS